MPMEILKGYKYRLRPSRKQTIKLVSWMGACGFIYNKGLEERIEYYNKTGKGLSYTDQQNKLPELKKQEGLEWLKNVPSQGLQYSLRNLDRAFTNFFRGNAEYPDFKKKHKSTDSITFPQGNRIEFFEMTKNNSYVQLPKLGKIKFRKHRDFIGATKSATITKEGSHFYISFCVKTEQDILEMPLLNKPIGLDKGVVHTIAGSMAIAKTKSHFSDLPVLKIKYIEKEIAKYQRKISKQEKFSPSWRHFKTIIGNLHRKITRIRTDFLHKLSYNVTNNHGLIVVEDLKLRNMTASAKGTIEVPGKNVAQKSGPNRSILRQGLGIFQRLLEYKSQWYGSHVVKVDPKYTSQTCCKCQNRSKENRKEQAVFHCVSCGHIENADINAAKNILRLGLESLGLTSLEAPTIAAQAV